VGIEFLPQKSLVVGGATSRGGTQFGGGRFLVGLGNPNPIKKGLGGVPGSVGDIFQRLDGEPGKTFYVKELGNNTTTGWIPK
jgi:expansin (peptidoglycan-binding protein)